ncbi:MULTISPECIES: nicotinate-nucleotide--dimethylbenzimidazole phosphoribosyltransferase [Sulfurospirillum]|uniref:Nicotinate-nucleotide--dimethylbenzimidazole phosphoribosyltransferase n=2 Tax=Sulfurospirillum TaxID=57665 RepID=A0A1D7TJX6_9BACT|nr:MULTISPECIES: nicotinate-nucleotide--dimethylbenzimidazole phosphoribosyltransferase [Sulfurospirillum]AOO65286.1 nicotinate-nucleotide--dimethylbenzimidazole phosphoribosyltransferase CobT [Sulfurospirillum halorespirans DSM 13726]WNZ00335.1 Nicotinate-nucleotide--dimethylbenzimidazole phosphoribosyltransferase [Sulfurospirillum sp. 'SP']WNZ00388.1 Nicotinate-nucleotide--dimethylbenzimidazole phosphoribosyltransferase [Sulfurospirillum sp. 'SP']
MMHLLEETLLAITGVNEENQKNQKEYIATLLKTPDGLGKLEKMNIQLSGIEKEYRVKKKAVVVMAADNGVEEEGVSASKRVITQYVVEAMVAGEASISSLCKSLGSELFVIDLGIDSTRVFKGAITHKIMPTGTYNIRKGPAMSREQAIEAIEVGIDIVRELVEKDYNLFAVGEMGIGNTTTSSACLKALTNLPLVELVGYGSGIDERTLGLKIAVVEDAVRINKPDVNDPIDIIQKLGGLDIAAMTGVYLGAARYKVPIVLDGLISGVSALLAYRMNAHARDYMIPSHISEEPGAKWIMEALCFNPMLHMNMKLGEGSGAVLVFPLVEAASNLTRDIRVYPEV